MLSSTSGLLTCQVNNEVYDIPARLTVIGITWQVYIFTWQVYIFTWQVHSIPAKLVLVFTCQVSTSLGLLQVAATTDSDTDSEALPVAEKTTLVVRAA
jgi:hypothetical protein